MTAEHLTVRQVPHDLFTADLPSSNRFLPGASSGLHKVQTVHVQIKRR